MVNLRLLIESNAEIFMYFLTLRLTMLTIIVISKYKDKNLNSYSFFVSK